MVPRGQQEPPQGVERRSTATYCTNFNGFCVSPFLVYLIREPLVKQIYRCVQGGGEKSESLSQNSLELEEAQQDDGQGKKEEVKQKNLES